MPFVYSFPEEGSFEQNPKTGNRIRWVKKRLFWGREKKGVGKYDYMFSHSLLRHSMWAREVLFVAASNPTTRVIAPSL